MAHCHTTTNWTFSTVFPCSQQPAKHLLALLEPALRPKRSISKRGSPRRNFRTTKARGADTTRHFVVTFPFSYTSGTPNNSPSFKSWQQRDGCVTSDAFWYGEAKRGAGSIQGPHSCLVHLSVPKKRSIFSHNSSGKSGGTLA